ncbi:hypothetical protein C8Q77DRAFT_1088524 [Trametes polyzona]|nr:hypothetical protein C8Q77DRAFT_1088524 [Trametes polyzona]
MEMNLTAIVPFSVDRNNEKSADKNKAQEAHTGLLSNIQRKLSQSSINGLFASYRANWQKDIQDTFGSPQALPLTAYPDRRLPGLSLGDARSNTSANVGPLSGPGTAGKRARASTVSGSLLSFSDVKLAVSTMITTRGRARSVSLANSVSAPGSKPSEDSTARLLWDPTQSAALERPDANVWTTPRVPPRSPGPGTPLCLHFRSGSSELFHNVDCIYASQGTRDAQDMSADSSGTISRCEEVRAGKRPQAWPQEDGLRKACDSGSGRVIAKEAGPLGPEGFRLSRNDSDGWFGLHYALALSESDVGRSPEVGMGRRGQYSKSREAWLLLHHDRIPHGTEEWEYQRWRQWHDQLDGGEGIS